MHIRNTGVISWFVQNPVAANLMMFFFMIAGLLTVVHIKKEILPETRSGVVSVRIEYPGASPEDMEGGIVKKVEDALQGMTGIKKIVAEASEGFADIRVTAKTDVAMPEFLNEVRSRVDAVDTFPTESEKPRIAEEIMKTEVMWLILHGPMDDGSLKALAKEIRDELTAGADVSQVDIVGTKPDEISINLSESSLRRFGLGFDDVADAVAQSSLDLPGGQIKTRDRNIGVRSLGQARTGRGFEDIAVAARPDGTVIRVKDVASVTDGAAEADGFLRYNGQKALGLQVFRSGDENTLVLADRVRQYVAEKRGRLPQGISLDIAADMSVHLKDRLSLMVRNMITGSLLVFISLALFLRLKVAFWVMLGLPVSFLGAVWLMPLPFIDASINMVTLYGFILVLGILVDDAIVIGESISDTIQKEGPGLSSVVEGARAVATPATFGVMTTVAAFVPMLTIPGPNGKMWAGIGWVVILCLLFSLVESKFVLPAHLRRMGEVTRRTGPGAKRFPSWFERLQDRVGLGLEFLIQKGYRPLLSACMRYRYATAMGFTAIFILAMVSVKAGIVKFVFFPDIDSDIVLVDLNMAGGVSQDRLLLAVKRIEDAAEKVNASFLDAGETVPPLKTRVSYYESEGHAGFYVELSPGRERAASTAEVIREWRRLTRDVRTLPGVKSLKFSSASSEAAGMPIDFELTGKDTKDLERMALTIKQALSAYDGVSDIRDTSMDHRCEVKLSVKKESEALGVTLREVARKVRYAYYGRKVQTLQRGSESVDVFVRYPGDERQNLAGLSSMWIRGRDGRRMPLTEVVRLDTGKGPAKIVRRDRRRVVSVRADVDKAATTPGRIVEEMMEKRIPELQPRYPGISVRAAGEAEEEEESLASMKKWGGLSLLAIFILMAVPLKSYAKPLIIMTAIPFGIVGAVLGHLIMGLPVSILSLCGVIALSGVVVNDALVLVDYIHRRLAAGDSVGKAVGEAGTRRFKAIFLTSMTTFLGLVPMVTEKSLQAQFLIPMAVSLAFGILFSTLITLFLIPALYLIMEDVVGLVQRRSKQSLKQISG